jgi:aspartyl-tRNA(Asn)/glutamyl-tRNA(Gln) amidotransferase subunit A
MKIDGLTIDGARAAIAAGETTATALAESHYARIESHDSEINSFLAMSRERAMAQAAKIDGMAAKAEALPVLAGIPVGIKDVLVMQGTPATAGSLILKGYQPPYDATAVTRLEAAGAVLLGKLN